MLRITKNIEEANLITHASKFHADEVFATAFLTRFIENPVICRVNNVPVGIRQDQLVYDIGFGKYDHHMKDFDERHESGVKYASFGLIFREFGPKYFESIDPSTAKQVFDLLEHDLVEGIDAVDNGEFPEVNSTYTYKSFDGIIGDFNAAWNEDDDNDVYFMEAYDFAYKYLDRLLKRTYAKVKSKVLVEDAIDKCEGKILYLDNYMPFKDVIISSDNPKAKDILFVIAPSNRGGYGIHTIPKDKTTHETRKDFPSSWGGLVDDELQNVCGVQTASFCHIGLFLATSKTLEDAYKMADIAINNNE